MAHYKSIAAFLVLCLVYQNECTPVTNERVSGRGIGSTVWGWITYPFTWWTSGSTDIPAHEDHITGADQDIEIATHNVTVWCNDQTCTTQRCDKTGCANTTCNIYDTDLSGECRHYNTIKPDTTLGSSTSDGPTSDKPTTVANSAPTEHSDEHTDERPLELEAVLSSTVTEVRDNDMKQ